VTPGSYQSNEEFAREMDARDPLAHFRDRFHIPKIPNGQECIYLCGHSLGLQPKSVPAYLQQELCDWAELGVEGHFRGKNPWFTYHRLLTEQTAQLVGAVSSEVVVMNSLTVNLHLMVTSFYRPTATRHKILMEGGAFPSDQYALKSQIRFHGFDPASSLMELQPRTGELCMREEDIDLLIDREGHSIALILLGGVNYVTGQAFDIAGITAAGHDKGCIVGFDLAHAAGNIPLRLHDWGSDFAVWCSYKYLNGGPGCVGGCFVHQRHAHAWSLPRFAGWWGHDEKTRFKMGPDFHPMEGAEGWQLSNPPVLALAPLRASMDIFSEAGLDALRAKSVSLTGYLEFLLREKVSSDFSIITPAEETSRGAQLSIRLSRRGREICDRLAAVGVITDWREPDILRVAPVPLYNSYADVFQFAQRFSAALP
jgi:kynureninase